jgi:hypothetical protein
VGGSVAAPTALPGLECAPRELVLEGAVGGVAVSERVQLLGPGAGYDTSGAFSGGVSWMFIETAEDGQPMLLSGGLLMFPEGSARAGEIWCIDPGSLMGQGDRHDGAFIGHRLGTCPGAPMDAALYACFDSSQGYCDDTGEPSRRTLGGQWKGAALDAPALGLTSRSAQAWISGTVDFKYALFADATPTVSSSASVKGLLMGTPEGPEAGKVYCIGGGQWTKYTDEFVLEANLATLSDISYVGDCRDAGPAESLDICLNR